jgi:DNA modification methylase
MADKENKNWQDLLSFNPYKIPVSSTRKGSIFQVHPYPTKINYKSIVPFILAHTKPGELVYDCFAGTCSTGLAVASCAEKDEDLMQLLDPNALDKVTWGARKALCVDIGVLPTFIGRTLLKKVDTKKLQRVFEDWFKQIKGQWDWLYKATDPNGRVGVIRYTYTTNVICCKNCQEKTPFIKIFVDFENGGFKDTAKCPKCNFLMNSKNFEPLMEQTNDKLLNTKVMRIKRIPYLVFGQTGQFKWKRRATEQDIENMKQISTFQLPESVKAVPMMCTGDERWGEMYRAGYHRDTTHLHHFYSERNFRAISILYNEAKKIAEEFRPYIILAISSYNAANSSLMTRFVFKKDNKNPVNTSAQPGALYIPNCQVEKNVFIGVKRKFEDILIALDKISRWDPDVEVKTIPAQKTGLQSNSIDYIFTDPPFGENIQYSELNFLSEAWLESFTDNRYETIVSQYQSKSASDYEKLLTSAFVENYRLLKPGKFMTVVFHNSSKELWNVLQRAVRNAGFVILDTSILNKTQTSFKQTTTEGAVKKDPIILAWKPRPEFAVESKGKGMDAVQFLKESLTNSEARSPERTTDYLFARFVGHRLSSGSNMSVDAKEFKKILTTIAEDKEGYWYIKTS